MVNVDLTCNDEPITLQSGDVELVVEYGVRETVGGTASMGLPSGGFHDGMVPLTGATTLADAIDLINQALLATDRAVPRTLGPAPDGSWGDGLVALSPADTLAGAIDTLNEAAGALQAVTAVPGALALGVSSNGPWGTGFAHQWAAGTHINDAMWDLDQGLATLNSSLTQGLAAAAAATAAVQAIASAPAQQALGGPPSSYSGRATITPASTIGEAVAALNVSLASVSNTAATALSTATASSTAASTAQAQAQSAAAAAGTARTLAEAAQATANAPGQRPLGTPTDGSWAGGQVPLAGSTLVADAIDALNAALASTSALATTVSGDVAAVAAAVLEAQDTADGALADALAAQDTAATAYSAATAAASAASSAQAAAATAHTEAAGALAAATEAQSTADTANGRAITAQSVAAAAQAAATAAQTDAGAAHDAATAAQAAAGAAQTTATGAATAAATAQSTANDASAAAATAQGAAANAQTTANGAVTAAATAQSTATTAQTTASGAAAAAATAQSAADAAATAAATAQATANNPAIRAIGTPADASWADGLVAIDPTWSINEAVDRLNEALLAVNGQVGTNTTAIGTNTSAISALNTALAGKAPTASPTLTGTTTFADGTLAAPAFRVGARAGAYAPNSASLSIVVRDRQYLTFEEGDGAGAAIMRLNAGGNNWFDSASTGIGFGNAASLTGYASDTLAGVGYLRVRNAGGDLDAPIYARWMFATSPDPTTLDGLVANGGNVRAGAARDFRWVGRSRIRDAGDGVISLLNDAAASFGRLCFAGTAATAAALKYLGASLGLAVRSGDDTAYMPLAMGAASVNGTLSVTALATLASATITGNASVGGTLSGVAATFTGALTANSLTLPGGAVGATNIAALGAGDVAAQTGGSFYRIWDFDESSPSTLFGTAQTGTNNLGQGGAFIKANEDVFTNVVDPTSMHHPGVMTVTTRSVGNAHCFYQSIIAFAPNSGTTTQVRILFRPPTIASDATNDYTFYVGAINLGNGVPIRGWYIRYRHSANSGNWVIGSINSAVSGEFSVNSSVPFTAGVWQTLLITFPPTGNQISMSLTVNGTTSSLGSITNTDMHAGVLNAITQIAGLGMVRNASDGVANRVGYIDRASQYITGMTNQGG